LETALFNVPQVVVYRVNILSYWIGKMLIKIKFISLVNLIAGKKVVTELIQQDFQPANIRFEMEQIQVGGPGRKKIMEGYEEIFQKIGNPGASKRAAELIFSYLQPKK
jgi:lipid-A-disaccharide synthase